MNESNEEETETKNEKTDTTTETFQEYCKRISDIAKYSPVFNKMNMDEPNNQYLPLVDAEAFFQYLKEHLLSEDRELIASKLRIMREYYENIATIYGYNNDFVREYFAYFKNYNRDDFELEYNKRLYDMRCFLETYAGILQLIAIKTEKEYE